MTLNNRDTLIVRLANVFNSVMFCLLYIFFTEFTSIEFGYVLATVCGIQSIRLLVFIQLNRK